MFPDLPRKGAPILEWAEEVQQWIEDNQLNAGVGISLTQGAGGWTISVDADSVGGSSILPWTIYQRDTPESSSSSDADRRNFRVYHGTVAGQSPDNDDTADEPLDILVDPEQDDLTLPWLVWLRAVRAEDGSITTATIKAVSRADILTHWVDYPNRNSPSNVVNTLIGKINTYADPQAPLVRQLLTENIDSELFQAWQPGTVYQYIADPTTPVTDDWRTLAIVPQNFGAVAISNAGDAMVIDESSAWHVWLEVTFTDWDTYTIEWAVGNALPAQPAITDCSTPPGTPFIIPLGTVSTEADSGAGSRVLRLEQTRYSGNIHSDVVLGGLYVDTGVSPAEIRQRFVRRVLVDDVVLAQTDSSDSNCDSLWFTVSGVDVSGLPGC